MVDFTSILSKKISETEKPKPRPTGNYRGVCVGMPTQKEAKVQGEDRAIISFKIKLQLPLEDVDQSKLAEHGDLSSWPTFNRDIWVDTPEGEWALRAFITDTLALEIDDDKTFGEVLAETAGCPLVVTLGHNPYTDKQGQPQIGTNIVGTAAV